MKPEARAEIILYDWLITKSLNIIKVYFNRKNELGINKFQVKGEIKKIPDFVISHNTINGIEYIAVEIKDATKSNNVQDSQKILDYYKNYYLRKTKYFIQDKEIKINLFCVATNNSPKGYLFNEEYKETLEDNKQDHEKLLKYNLFPRYEYRRTHDLTRGLISRFKDLRKEFKIIKEAPGIAILISNLKINNNVYCHGVKYLNREYWNQKSKWAEKFWRL